MDEKIKFIEEVKIKKDALKKAPDFKHSNPIRANLMKFVHFKLDDDTNFKKDFE